MAGTSSLARAAAMESRPGGRAAFGRTACADDRRVPSKVDGTAGDPPHEKENVDGKGSRSRRPGVDASRGNGRRHRKAVWSDAGGPEPGSRAGQINLVDLS